MKNSTINWLEILVNNGFAIISGKSGIYCKKSFTKGNDYTDLIGEIDAENVLLLSVKRFTKGQLKTVVPKLPLHSKESFKLIINSFTKIIKQWQTNSKTS